MMNKVLAELLCVWLLVLLLPAAGYAEPAPDTLTLVIGTDLHYLAPELTDHGAYFKRVLDNADGKMTMYCEELTDAFLAEVEAMGPDALILTGDLTFNGALESHRALAEKLRRLEAAGVPVLVLTGNHDVYNINAARFEGDSFSRVASATTENFREIYREFGLDDALSIDEESASYLYELADGTWIFMLDANTYLYPCGLPKSTLNWVEKQLSQAAGQGKRVIAACHQNLLQHSMFRYGYVLDQADALREILEKYGVTLFLSGHLHMQHVMEQGSITEIATSALCSYPSQYGVLRGTDGRFSYETRITDVSAWAVAKGYDDANLLQFAVYASNYFDLRTRNQTVPLLAESGFSEEEQIALSDYACAVNRIYFSGHMELYESLDSDGTLRERWRNTDSLYGVYLNSIQPDAGNNYNIWQIG